MRACLPIAVVFSCVLAAAPGQASAEGATPPATHVAQVTSGSDRSAGEGLIRPDTVAGYSLQIDEAKARISLFAGPDRERARARLRLLERWRSEDVEMNSPAAFGAGLALGTLGTISTVIALAFIAKWTGGLEGSNFGWGYIGYGMLAPSALLLGGGAALIVVGVRPVMRAPVSPRGEAGFAVHLSPTGGVFGTF